MRKTILIFSIIYLTLLNSSFAQKKNKHSLLWEITGKGLKSPSYLFGTIHAICPEDLIISELIKNKISNSDQMYLEIDMDDPSLMLNSIQGMTMKDGSTLKKLLSEEDYKIVNNYFKDSVGFDLGRMAKAKPILISAFLYGKMLGCKMPSAFDVSLMQEAKSQKKEIFGLETLQEQMEVLDKIPYKKQADMLVEMIKDFKKSSLELKKLLSDYKEQDLDKLYVDMQKSSDGIQDYQKDLLSVRNKKWIPIIEKQIKEKSTFFAFGAAHLAGKDGVIQLLRKKGFKVKPI